MRPILIVGLSFALACSGHAADSTGKFFTGGGAGSSGCPDFLNAMATARQHGGLGTIKGITAVDGFVHYVLGFQTGFNSEAIGIYNIFKSLGENPGVKALYAIEPWCAQNPDKRFSSGVLELAQRLRSKEAQ